mgnify:CR=1 FL=1
MITETDDIAAAIDVAQSRLPGASRADALRHLVLAGAEHVLDTASARRALVRRHAGAFGDDVFPAHPLDELRDDWPA